MNRSRSLAASILFPIVLMALWTGHTISTVSAGRVIEFKVRGYDPRDLLAGHYVTYQVDYGVQDFCPGPRSEEECGCLFNHDGDPFSQISRIVPCAEAGGNECPLFIRGRCVSRVRFEAGIERYYFREGYSMHLMTVPPESSIRVSIDDNGRAIVTDFLIAGQTVPEYVAERTTSAPPSDSPE